MTKKQFNELKEGYYWVTLIPQSGRGKTTIIQVITISGSVILPKENIFFRLGYNYKESLMNSNNWTQFKSVKRIME